MEPLNLKAWNKCVVVLNENQINDLITKHGKKGYFIVSACRSNLSEKENQQRTNKLKEDLKSLGLTYTVVYGGGFQEKQSKGKKVFENPEINETSFLVYNYKRDKNTGHSGSIERDELFQTALNLCKKYDQDDIYFKEPDGKAHWYDRNGNVDATFGKDVKINDRTQQFFTAFGKNIEGSNKQGKNGNMQKSNADRFSGVFEGIYFNPPTYTEIDRQRRIRLENEVFVEASDFDSAQPFDY